VRDVESALNAYLRKRIDHRVISVVMEREEADGVDSDRTAGADAAGAGMPAKPVTPPPAEARRREPAEGPTFGESSLPAAPARGTRRERLRFVSANLYVAGLRTQAQVEIAWQGVTRMGSATGPSTRDNAARLVASATLQALQPFLGEVRTLAVQDVARVRMGGRTVVVVAVKLLEQRSEKALTGSCTLEHDLPQTVVFATLSAVNRILGGVAVREPVEYELRPTST
jgi:hypothetical protein